MSSSRSKPTRKGSTLHFPDALLNPGSWRNKRARSGSRSGSPTHSGTSIPGEAHSQDVAQSSTYLHNSTPGGSSEQVTSEPSRDHQQDNASPLPGATSQIPTLVTTVPPSTQNTAKGSWTGLEQALQALHITTKGCPPLHSAVEGVISCLHVFKEAVRTRKDYDDLASGLTAMVQLLTKQPSVACSGEIVDTITQISGDIAKEVEEIRWRQSDKGARRVLGASGDEDDLIRRYRRIDHLFRLLQAEASMSTWNDTKRHLVNTQLENLGPVKLAAYNSAISTGIGRRLCTENTRTQILNDTMEWANNPNGAKIYWMNGMAGTSKTTIAYTFCEQLQTIGQLAASFFFTRTSRECSEANQIVPTIAYQLARRSASFRDALCGVLDKDPDVGSLNTTLQFDSLLVKPLIMAGKTLKRNLVIVVDALDECNDPHAVTIVLDVLFRFAADLPVKFFVTSRPEPAIRNSMLSGISECNRADSILYLHEVEKSLVQADIARYLKHELSCLTPDYSTDIEALAERAGNLFIYASTAIRYIQPKGKVVNSRQRLKSILEVNQNSKKGLADIDVFYYAILSAGIDDDVLEPEERDNIQVVLWTVICACESVLIETLATLSGLEIDLTYSALQPLHSVLHVPEHNGLVTTLHASFPDFMFSRDRSLKFFCDRSRHDRFLVKRCLDIMKEQLRFNICQLESSFALDNEIPNLKKRVETYISHELFYACRFWVDHLTQASNSSSFVEMVHEFLLHQLLFWMEVLNLKRYAVVGAIASTKIHMWLKNLHISSGVVELARDAQTFVGNYVAHEASASTPHIYISALPLSSSTSHIRLAYYPRFKGLISAKGTVMERIDQAPLDVWKMDHSSVILSASFSTKRKPIALVYRGDQLHVRYFRDKDSSIGLRANWRNGSFASFLDDENILVSASYRRTEYTCSHTEYICSRIEHIFILNITNGSISGPYEGHTEQITSIALSPNQMRLVSGSKGRTIRIWANNNPPHSQLLLIGHTAPVRSVVFSPNGLQICSGSDDHAARIWDALRGVLVHTLCGHTQAVSCVQFLPSGALVFSGSIDSTIRTWDTHHGTPIGNPFQGHIGGVVCIAVSPDGERGEASLASWAVSSKHFVDTQLKSLCPVKLASFDSEISTTIGRRSCTQNTRTHILIDLMKWADNPDGTKIYWMNGMAGTGKTTIAYSFCQALEEASQLAASFFCTRASSNCRDAGRIVSTIAYQLARHSAPFRRVLSRALDKDPDISSRDFSKQFDSLLAAPLTSVQESMASNLVIVIDALDECNDPSTVGLFLTKLFRFAASCPLKFFVTSRPESMIRESMMAGITGFDRRSLILYLHGIEKSLVQADIQLYLEDELSRMLPAHRTEIRELGEQAGNLFIYAATAVRYIQPPGKAVNSKQRLKTILAVDKKSNDGLSGIDKLYTTILTEAINDEELNSKERDAIKTVLWTAVCVYEPVLVETLATLSGLEDREYAIAALQPLRSVLYVSEHSNFVTTLHASFLDYMFSGDRSGQFSCGKTTHNEFLAISCLEIMKAQLRFNICHLESSFILDDEVPNLPQRTNTNITSELFYACRFWVDHLTQGNATESLVAWVQGFLSQQLLFWMEVLNLKKCIVIGAIASTKLHMWLQSLQAPSDLVALARDAQTFVGNFAANPVSRSTPHIYISALPLSSPASHIRLIYQPQFVGLIQATGTIMDQIDRACLAVWTSNSLARSVSFSCDRKSVVTGDKNGCISVRNLHTGEQLVHFQAHLESITSVAFSSDARLIASSSQDCSLQVWNVSDGSLAYGPFIGHTSRVNSAVFSSDGMHLVSGSDDRTIRIWDTNNPSRCQLVFEPEWSFAPVKSALLSPDGLQIASHSGNDTIHVWDLNGVLLHCLRGHTRSITCVGYSPCGTFICSGSYDRTIRVWNARNGSPIGSPFEGHSDCITSISVSPEGQRIVSGSLDRTIRVWHRSTGELIAGPFVGHTAAVSSVGFSVEGARIISVSDEKIIRVWNAQGRTQRDVKKIRTSAASSLRKSAISPSGAYIASEHEDGSIWVWNIQNGTLETIWRLQDIDTQKGNTLLLTFSPDGRRIFVAYRDGVLRALDVQTGQPVEGPFRFSPHEWVAYNPFALSTDGRSVVSTRAENFSPWPEPRVLDLWDLQTDRLVCTIEARDKDDYFSQVAFSSNGAQLTTRTKSSTVDVWDRFSGHHLAGPFQLDPGSNDVGMNISPDGTHILYRSYGNDIGIHNVIDGTHSTLPVTSSLEWHRIIFSPGEKYSALIGEWSIELHDITGGRLLNDLQAPNDFTIGSATFVASGSCLVLTHRTRAGTGTGTVGFELKVYQVQVGMPPAVYSLEKDGWVLDKNSNRVVWLPPEIQDQFLLSSGSHFTAHESITVNYDNILIGDKWSECHIGG